jgi:hypothetical protein
VRAWARLVAVALVAAEVACTSPVLQLPTGAPTALPDASAILRDAIGHCPGMRSITAEIGLSGRVGGTKLRGRLQAGFAQPDRLRLEAIAPFGAPFFVLAGAAGRSTLWLPRDARVLRDASAVDIVEALAGFSALPGDLAAWIAGCPAARFEPGEASAFGSQWARVASGERTAWFHLSDRWRLVQTEQAGLAVEFANHAGVQPGRVRIRRAAAADRGAVDVGLAIAQVETNVPLGDEAFSVDVRGDAAPMTLEELRRSGPLRESTGGTR